MTTPPPRPGLTTALAAAGLSPRAVSALAGAHVSTVGELLALDSTLLNRLVAPRGQGDPQGDQSPQPAMDCPAGPQKRPAATGGLMGLDQAVGMLRGAVSGRAATRGQAADLLLGITGNLDAFASNTELAEKLDKAAQRGPQLLKELQSDWAENTATAELLDAVTDIAAR